MASDRAEIDTAMLEQIAKTGPRSRADLGRATGITRATLRRVVYPTVSCNSRTFPVLMLGGLLDARESLSRSVLTSLA